MKLLVIFIACLISTAAAAFPVSSQKSRLLAENFIASMFHVYDKDYSITGSDSISENGIVLFRIYNLSPQGYIIISADDRFYPVPAFSNDGNYTGEDMPGMKLFLNKWKREAINTLGNQNEATTEISVLWENLSDFRYALNTCKQVNSVSPLLTTKWNQDYPYNIACPPDAGGSGGYTYAGCVATAMGQLMFYHRWPLTGNGSYSYVHPVYGTISADFAATTYNWDAMPNRVITENQSVAIMLHHLGVAVDMNYGPNGSGMWNHSAALAFRNYFKYCPETRYVFRDSTTLNWDSLVITNLNAGKPLYYAGWEDTTYTMGHAFVCDGYETNDYYHFNWGWGSLYDGYFYTGQLNPGGANFNFCQELIVDMYPDTNNYTYPSQCAGLKEITDATGTFSDGSGLNNYPAGADCSWWLNPSCGIIPELSFDAFDLNSTDTLYVFEGTPSSHYLRAFYTGDNPPYLNGGTTPTLLRTDSGSFYILFRSYAENKGFVASYNNIFCLSNDTLNDINGIITDGSGSCDYRRTTNCKWVIEAPQAEIYHFTTEEFDLFAGSTAHFIQIYKGSISTANLAYKFTSVETPPATFEIEATKLIFRFLTTTTGSGQGWTFNYSSSPLSVKQTSTNSNFYVFPNPATNNSVIQTGKIEKESTLLLSDVSGKVIQSVGLYPDGKKQINLYEIFPSLKPGYYFLSIINEKGKSTTCFVIN